MKSFRIKIPEIVGSNQWVIAQGGKNMNNRFLICFVLLLALTVLSACQPAGTQTPTAAAQLSPSPSIQANLDDPLPGDLPAVFRPGGVSSEAVELSLVVHPNLQEIYFTRLQNGEAVIYTSRLTAAGWTQPEPAPFSGQYNELAPFITAGGDTLYFCSQRPAAGSTTPSQNYHIWVAARLDEGWAEPSELHLPLESASGELHPSLTRDGTLYYQADYPDLGGEGFYRARQVDGAFQTPEKVNLKLELAVEPYISPDETFLLFYAAGTQDNLAPAGNTGDLYAAFRVADGTWSEPLNLGEPVNSTAEESTPTLSPDGQYLFFASNRPGGRFPDLYWIETSRVLMLNPAQDERQQLTYANLMDGFDFNEPLPESALTPPDEALPPAHSFEGRLELLGQEEGAHIKMVRGELEPAHAWLPEFDFAFMQTADGWLLPQQRGLIITDHPLWNLHLEPGRAWQEPADQGLTRASLPFTLSVKGGNAAFNGTLTFLFGEDQVSQVWYQVTQEITTYVRADLWGLLEARYHPQSVQGAEQIRQTFLTEQAARIPLKPIEALAEDYLGADPSAFGGGLTPEHVSWYGFVIDGVNYLGGCRTRYGIYPYCEAMRATSYSTAKSTFASLALMRLEQKYGPGVTELLIRDYVPESAAGSGNWEEVTFENTLDMATGNYFSSRFMADDNGEEMNTFFGAQPYSRRIAAAFTAPYQTKPGNLWVYRTSDTFILISAMQAYLQEQEGSEADIFDFVVDEVYRPLGMASGFFSSMRTADNNWQGQPEGGMGLWWTADDAAKISLLLNKTAGQINGEQVLDPGLLAAALQQDPDDRGLRIDSHQMYNNAFWARSYGKADGFDCEFWVVSMQGVSGNVIALFPNGTAYYYFSDNQEFTWETALRAADGIYPICE